MHLRWDFEREEKEIAVLKLEEDGFLVSVSKNRRDAIHLMLNPRLEQLRTSHGLTCVRSRIFPRLSDVFTTYCEPLATTESPVEGVVICLRGPHGALKWKGAEESYNPARVRQVEMTVAELRRTHPGASGAISMVAQASPRFRERVTLGRRLEEAYLSARTKFPTAEDELGCQPGGDRERLLRGYSKKIGREMVEADGDGEPGFAREAVAFVLASARKELQKKEKG